jgi:Protein of unknown function (DUF3047)
MPISKDNYVPKQYPFNIWITTGLLTTLAASTPVWAAEPSAFSQGAGTEPPAPWHFVGLPERYAKPPTQFDLADIDGKKVLRVRAEQAYGNLLHPWKGSISHIKIRWRLDTPLLKASLKSKVSEDSALKVCLSFDMPLDNVPAVERTKFRLAQLFSKTPLPTATLCYVWAHAENVGSELPSPYTGRLRYIVLNSGENQLKTWQEHQRDVQADFLKAFGSESAKLPPVTAIIVGADSDNTHDASLGYVADIVVQP